MAKCELNYFWHLSRVHWANRLLRRHVEYLSRCRALDIGCGTGGFLHLLDREIGFAEAVGVDAVAGAVDRAQRLGGDYRFVDPTTFVPERSPDILFLMDVLEHIEDDGGFLRRCLGFLRPSGYALCTVPAMQWLYSDWDRALGHHRRYTTRQFRALATHAGAEVVYLGYGFSYLLPAAWWRSRIRPSPESAPVFPPTTAVVKSVLLALNRVEVAASGLFSVPFGTSVVCLLRKKS